MSDEFGDVELADQWDEETVIAPEQVTMRMHALRREIDELTGRDPGEFDELTDAEQELALSIGVAIVNWIVTHGIDNPALLAESIHNVRVYLSHGVIPDWDDLPPDHQQIAIDICTLVIDWLHREGPR